MHLPSKWSHIYWMQTGIIYHYLHLHVYIMFTVVDLYGKLGGKYTSLMNDHETLGVQVNVNPCFPATFFFSRK